MLQPGTYMEQIQESESLKKNLTRNVQQTSRGNAMKYGRTPSMGSVSHAGYGNPMPQGHMGYGMQMGYGMPMGQGMMGQGMMSPGMMSPGMMGHGMMMQDPGTMFMQQQLQQMQMQMAQMQMQQAGQPQQRFPDSLQVPGVQASPHMRQVSAASHASYAPSMMNGSPRPSMGPPRPTSYFSPHPAQVYAPSEAPTERRNINQPGRYQTVSTPNIGGSDARSTMTSTTLQPPTMAGANGGRTGSITAVVRDRSPRRPTAPAEAGYEAGEEDEAWSKIKKRSRK